MGMIFNVLGNQGVIAIIMGPPDSSTSHVRSAENVEYIMYIYNK